MIVASMRPVKRMARDAKQRTKHRTTTVRKQQGHASVPDLEESESCGQMNGLVHRPLIFAPRSGAGGCSAEALHA